MPLLATRGAASVRGFGMFASMGGIGAPYWIGLLTGLSDQIGYSVAVDSSGNVYVCGVSNASGTDDIQIAKYDTSGAIQWQRSLGASGSSEQGRSVAVDSSGNVYVCGVSDASGTNDIQIAKYDTSGAIQWQRRLGGTNADFGRSVAVDSSGNVYVCGTSGGLYFNIQIAKYNTSGTIQWQRSLGGGSSDKQGQSVAVDSSGNVYVCGHTTTTSGTLDFQIAKYNTSGTIQWQRSLGASGSSEQGYSVAVDSSGNVYVCGYATASNDIQIAKYDTSGAIQWQRSLNGSVEAGYSVAVDSSGNVYVCGYSIASGTPDLQIAKYNTSGGILWQRRLGGSSGGGTSYTDYGYSVAVDSSGNVYVCGYSILSGNADFLFAKLPGNGTLTGTYSVGGYFFTYAASSLTDAATSLTSAASSLTDAATSLTSAASSLTDAATTLTSSVTTI